MQSILLLGLPVTLDDAALLAAGTAARSDLDDETSRTRAGFSSSCQDPARSGGGGSALSVMAGLEGIRSKFPFLRDFSDSFVRSQPLETLLKMETTSIKVQEFEKSKAASSKLAANRDKISSTFSSVLAGRDNRWDELHPARFLPGAGCSAGKLWLKARDVLGEGSFPPIGTFDMASVGLAGFVSKRGWCELHQLGSDSISLKMFNINACSSKTSSTVTSSGSNEEFKDILDLGEFKLALRVAREAQSFVTPWNKSLSAIEGFMIRSNFCASDLVGVEKPALILTQFVDFALESNADRWKNREVFLSTGELKTAWDSFYGAKPESKLPKAKIQQNTQKEKGKGFFQQQNLGFFDDVCCLYNLGKCVKPPGSCSMRSGIPLRHICNFRANPSRPMDICAKFHPCCFNH